MTVNEGAENVVHHGLEGGGGVSKSKVHDHGFPDAKIGLKCCFPLVAITDTDVVIPPLDIESGENE